MSDVLFSKILFIIWVSNLILPAVFAVASVWLNYTLREERFSFAYRLQKLKYDKLDFEDDPIDYMLASLAFDGLIIGTFLLSLGGLYSLTGFSGLIAVLITVVLFFLPRFFVDVTKSLKYNKNTGSCERIDKLEAELRKLKGE